MQYKSSPSAEIDSSEERLKQATTLVRIECEDKTHKAVLDATEGRPNAQELEEVSTSWTFSAKNTVVYTAAYTKTSSGRYAEACDVQPET